MRLIVALILFPALIAAQPASPRALEREILEELIEINTSDSAGRTGALVCSRRARLVGNAGAIAFQTTIVAPGRFLCAEAYDQQHDWKELK